MKDAQREARATSRKNLSQLLPGRADSRDITIEHLERQMAELTQIMFDSRPMKPAEAATPRQTEGQNKEPTLPPREGRDRRRHKTHVSLGNRTNNKTVATCKRRRTPEQTKFEVDLCDTLNAK